MKKKFIGALLGIYILGVAIGGSAVGLLAKEQPSKLLNNNIMAYNWLVHSGEATALERQAYNTGIENLQEAIKNHKEGDKPLAVIMDVDETVVNNAGYLGWQIKNNKGYSKDSYTAWVNQDKATPIAGALEFTNEAKKLGIEIFYVTNRYEDGDLQGTIKNLSRLGFPYADSTHILLKSGSKGSKEDRWNSVKANFNVIMQVGDNLTDFNKMFEKKSNSQEQTLVNENAEDFGTKYLVIPNPVYGNFESAMYDYNFKKTDEQKIQDQYKQIEATTIN